MAVKRVSLKWFSPQSEIIPGNDTLKSLAAGDKVFITNLN
jgi:hypothetical protein